MNIVGTIRLESGSGDAVATLRCAAPSVLRPAEIRYQGMVYHQNRQDEGIWVYRAFHKAQPGVFDDDAHLCEIVPPPAPVEEPPPVVEEPEATVMKPRRKTKA